jgi:hypothetical protein
MEVRRRIGMVLATAILAVLASGSLAWGAADPGKLWKAYPLDPGQQPGAAASPAPSASASPTAAPSASASPAPSRAASSSPSGADGPAEPLPRATPAAANSGSDSPLRPGEPLFLALLAVLALGAALLVRSTLRRGARVQPAASGGASGGAPVAARPRSARRRRGRPHAGAERNGAAPNGSARFARGPGAPATCAIRCRTGVRRAQFYAISFRPDGTWERLGQSAPFPLNGDATVERSPEAEERLHELERRLEDEGWAPAGDGRAWYEREFQRGGGPA